MKYSNLEHYLYHHELLVDTETIKKLEFPLGENHEVVKNLRLTTMMNSYEAEEYLMIIHALCMRLSAAAVRGTTAAKNLHRVLKEISSVKKCLMCESEYTLKYGDIHGGCCSTSCALEFGLTCKINPHRGLSKV